MKETPIIFNDEMVRAILDGRKAQTRRVMKPQPNLGDMRWNGHQWEMYHGYPLGHDVPRCPYGSTGDRLWVKERWRNSPYGYDYAMHPLGDRTEIDPEWGKWENRLFMPKAAARIILEIKSVRVEGLQDISSQDAKAEGLKTFTKDGALLKYSHDANDRNWADMSRSPIGAFTTLWNSINEKKGFGWDENPWVWVIEFKRLTNQEEER